jgi:hypothetical protein
VVRSLSDKDGTAVCCNVDDCGNGLSAVGDRCDACEDIVPAGCCGVD